MDDLGGALPSIWKDLTGSGRLAGFIGCGIGGGGFQFHLLPFNSIGFRWIPLDSVGFRWIEFGGV